VDCLDPSDVEDAECIRAMILSDRVCDDDNRDDATESNESYVEPREGVAVCIEDATSDDNCYSEVETIVYIGKYKTK
jgi:hypothetical protein